MKYHLYDRHRSLLKEWRVEKELSAEKVSEMLGHHKSWLGQIERGRLVSIKEDDLLNLLSILLTEPIDELIQGDCVEKFVYNYNPYYEDSEKPFSLTNMLFGSLDKYTPAKRKEISSINLSLSQASSFIKEKANELDEKFLEDLSLCVFRFWENVHSNPYLMMEFASLPFDLLFTKYKNNPEKINEVYFFIHAYLQEKIDSDDAEQ